MAIVQISRITQRKGLQEDLPQLAGAEFGWSVDERRLFIGNGTLEEGAPVVGNTEILTEFSDILVIAESYTYKGEAAGYVAQTGPTPGSPVKLSLQSWMDQWASVKDFGAVGDGVTDDTDAINRALYQIYCREINPQIRRSIFFPAGVYLITDTIIVPPYATLYGEGPDNSIIKLAEGASADYVMRTGDSLQQSGVNIGNNGATPPYSINITQMAFVSDEPLANIVLIQDAVECNFLEVDFHGPRIAADLTTDSNPTIGVSFDSTPSLNTSQIKFYNCRFQNTTYGIYSDNEVTAITIESSQFDTLYQGIVLGTGTIVGDGPRGFSVSTCVFNNIYAEGVVYGTGLNATSQNTYFDVGNHFGGFAQPYTAIVDFLSGNNISVGDMFERPDAYAQVHPRIKLNSEPSIAFTNAEQLAMGSYVRQTGIITTLEDAQSPAAIITTIDNDYIRAFSIDYTIIRDLAYRKGTITVATAPDDSTGGLEYSDDYVQNLDTGVTLSFTQSGSTVDLKYVCTSTGTDAQFSYSITHLA